MIKKHIVNGFKARSQDGTEEAEDDSHDTTPEKSDQGVRSELSSRKTQIEYIVQLAHTNKNNFSVDALGGLNYQTEEWWLEIEQSSVF